MISIKTTALMQSNKRTTEPVVVFRADGTVIPGLLLGGEEDGWPRLSSDDCYGQSLETCQKQSHGQSEMELLPEL